MTAPIAVSESSIAPSTASSASRFCGGTAAAGSACVVLTGRQSSRNGGRATTPGDVRVRASGRIPACRPEQNTCSHDVNRRGRRAGRLSPIAGRRPQRGSCPHGKSRSVRGVRAVVHTPARVVWTALRTSVRGRRPPALAGSGSPARPRRSARRARARLGSCSAASPRRPPRPRPARPRPRPSSSSSASASSVARTASACAPLGGLRLGPLGGLHRGQLLLGRQLAAFGDDEGLHLGGDALEHVHRDAEAADPLDHVEVDLAAVDADLARPPDLLGDVGRRDGAEERTCRAGLDLEPQDGLRRASPRSRRPARPTRPRAARAALRSGGSRRRAPGVATSASCRGSR